MHPRTGLALLCAAAAACSRVREASDGAPPPTPAAAPTVARDSAFGPTGQVDTAGHVTPIAGTPGLRAKAAPDCAPWDGPAIRLTIVLSKRERLALVFWGQAFGQMTGGPATIVLDGVASASGTGMATICPLSGGTAANPCRQVTARVDFDASGTREGSSLRGRAVIRDDGGPARTYPFSVVLESPPGMTKVCG